MDRGYARGLLARIDGVALSWILLLFLFSRALLLIVGLLTASSIDDVDGIHEWLSLTCRWDCGWYMAIADHGYSTAIAAETRGATNYAFFPIFPLLMRGISYLTGWSLVTSGALISNLCFIASLVYVYRYSLQLGYARSTGLLAVALLCALPQSFVFSAVYTESLFMLLLIAAMFHMHRGDYWRAGLAAAVLSATRATGIFFLVFALAWIVRRYGVVELLRPWRRPEIFIPVLLTPLGLFAWWIWCYQTTGDAFAQPSTVGHGWGWNAGFFLENLKGHFGADAKSRFWATSTLLVFAGSLLLLRLRLYEEFALCLGILLLLWSGQVPNSLLRYSIVLFPVWIALARCIDGRSLWVALVFSSFALINGFLMVAWTLGRVISI